MVNPDYKITDEDIQTVINYLKVHKPEKANAKVAWELLSRLYSKLHVLGHIDQKAIEQIADDIEL